MAQMKEKIKTPEKDLKNKEVDNLSDAEFKTLANTMLIEMTEFGGNEGRNEGYTK